MNLFDLDEALARYEAALSRPPFTPESLASPPESPPTSSEDNLLMVLLIRDEIHRALKYASPSFDAIARLAALDEQLKAWSKSHKLGVHSEKMSRWRDALRPQAKKWWWSLDELAKPSALWTLLAGLFFAACVAVGADTFTVLRSVPTTRVTILGTLTQTVLALIAGSAFTAAGRNWLHEMVSAAGIDRRFRGASRTLLAFVALVAILALRVYLPPRVSDYFNQSARDYAASGLLGRSIESYQQAIALRPDFADAHFGLAVSLDKSREYDKAIDEYKRVIELDANRFAAVNNLARLYIVHRKDPRSALPLLRKLTDRISDLTVEARYYSFKNLGWALLETESVLEAEAWLGLALRTLEESGDQQLRSRCGAAARFLLGKAFESQKRLDKANEQWELFGELLQQYPEQHDELEPEWPAYVQMRTLSYSRAKQTEKGGPEKSP